MPASIMISMNLAPITGVLLAGLRITVLPATTGPTVVPVRIASGKFHGGITRPAPNGM